ncbi:MAG: response regulator [Candidatus Rokuibacteriota bacterium]|nr:MAG: response regulator [Candidatus Rokubacteria bacterium]
MAKRILLVEDDRFLRRLHEVGLRKQGFTVLTAIDGEDGLRLAQAERPDLVLLDLVMPKLQGFEVLRMLKAVPETAAIPIVVLSSLGGDADVQAALRAGAASYIVKTAVAMPELVAKVEAALATPPQP